jgi:hypothetical protein
VEALIGMRPYEEEKVVTFDVEEAKTEEAKTEATADQTTTVTDAAAAVEPSTNNEASTETHS